MTTPMIEDFFFSVVFVHGSHQNDMSVVGQDGNPSNQNLYFLPPGTYDIQLSHDGAQASFIQLHDTNRWREMCRTPVGPGWETRRSGIEQVSLPKGGRFTVKTTPPQPDGAPGVATVRVIRTPMKT